MKINTKQIVAWHNRQAGNTLLVALLMLSVLSVVGANVLMSVSSRYNYTQKAVGWSEALGAAEAGADYALANCRWTVTNGATSSWGGWKKNSPAGSTTWVSLGSPSLTPPAIVADANSELAAGRTIIYDLPPDDPGQPGSHHLVSTSEGTTELWYHTEVDSPSSFVVAGNRWYRIRSTGYAGLAGFARASADSLVGATTHNDILRKFDLLNDHFIARYGNYKHTAGATVTVTPQATRRVETIARPQTPFTRAIVATATATPAPVVVPLVDSFDSTDATHYPLGLYTSLPRNPSTGVGVNAPVYVNAPIASFGGNLYGDLGTNNGTVTTGSNIHGTVTNNTDLPVPPVTAPSWAVTASGTAPPVLLAGPASSPSHHSYTSINNLTVSLPVGQLKGAVDIYVAGNVGNALGTGSIVVSPGVTAKIYFEGNFNMKALNIVNGNFNAANLQFYGITPTDGSSKTVTIGTGLAGYTYFTLDAPAYAMTVQSSLLPTDLMGSFTVKTLAGNGNTAFHYDEALATVGEVLDYQRVSWVEDPR